MNNQAKKLQALDWIVLCLPALTACLLHLIVLGKYGYFRDEFYYLACADHPAFGYVDQPPLSILILKIIRMTIGDSVTAIRILPAIGHGAVVFMAGLFARALGGKRFAVLLGETAALAPLGNLVVFHFFSMNFLDILFWQILIFIIVRIIQTGNPRLWLLFGLIAGIGLENKISILFLGFGIAIGLLLTRKRKYFKEKQLWIGALIAGLLFLPYLIWNATHDWATLEFMHNAKTYKMASVNPLQFLTGQILYNNPVSIIFWLAGLYFLFFHREGKTYRPLGWMVVSIFVLLMIQQAKDYYLAATYPILFAAGAVLWEKWLRSGWRIWFRPVLIFILAVSTGFLLPVTLPILPVEKAIAYIQKIGIEGTPGENHEMGVLPQYFADMHGWEEMVKTVADVYDSLSDAEKKNCVIYVRDYGQAGAIDLLGKKYGLPRATCAHNNYWYWGPPEWNGQTAIIFGWSHNLEENLRDLKSRFENVKLAATFTNPYCMPYENNRQIFICRNANFDFERIWQHEKHFD